MNENLLHPKPRRRLGAPVAALVLLVVAAGSFALGRMSAGDTEPADAVATTDGTGGTSAVVVGDAAGTGGAGGAEGEIAVAAPVPMGEPIPGTDGLRRLEARIDGSLAATITEIVGSEVGPALTLVTSRLLVWSLDVSRDIRPADSLELLYSLPADEEPVVHALRFHSHKLDKTIQAYRFQAEGAAYPRYYDENGREVELRLDSSPIAHYEEITSLLKDGRHHEGVDFKAPVGTPVVAPWSGVVRRVNWNRRYNGGCMDIEDSRGRHVYFLHLSDIARGVRPGTRVKKGQQVALSGNTGRSTAPHLHYQLMSRSGRVLDPFEIQPSHRVALPADQKAAFEEAMASLLRHFVGTEGGTPVASTATTN